MYSLNAVNCITQHIKAYREQAIKEETANFGKPCETCLYMQNCDLDWLSKMQPIISQSDICINVADLEQPDRLDSGQNRLH